VFLCVFSVLLCVIFCYTESHRVPQRNTEKFIKFYTRAEKTINRNYIELNNGGKMKRFICMSIFFMFVSVIFSQPAGYLHLNKVISRMEANQLATGVWVAALHPSTAMALVEANGYPSQSESMSRPMVDFIVVDYEHSPYDVSELRNFLHALTSKREIMAKGNLQPNIATLVRLPCEGPDPVHAYIKQVLDIGVHGIVIPNVRTASEAMKIIQSMRYPQAKGSPIYEPVGKRGLAPWIAAYQWGISNREYMERADLWPLNPHGDIFAVLQIETPEGVSNIEEILKVPGIGAILFGPADYSMFAGYPMQSDHPEVLAAQQKVKDACDQVNIPFIGFANKANISRQLEENYKMLIIQHQYRDEHVRFDEIFKAVEKIYY